jgi:hypothetical protein
MIITDPEHRRLKLKWRDYHGIIAQQTPYQSHNTKRDWFVLVFDVIILQSYYLDSKFWMPFNANYYLTFSCEYFRYNFNITNLCSLPFVQHTKFNNVVSTNWQHLCCRFRRIPWIRS